MSMLYAVVRNRTGNLRIYTIFFILLIGIITPKVVFIYTNCPFIKIISIQITTSLNALILYLKI